MRDRVGGDMPHEATDGFAVSEIGIEPGFQALVGENQRHAIVNVCRRAAGGFSQYRDARLAVGALGPDASEEERLPILTAQKVWLLGFGARQPLEPAIGGNQTAMALERRLVELGGGHRLDSRVDRLRRLLPCPLRFVAPPHGIERQLRIPPADESTRSTSPAPRCSVASAGHRREAHRCGERIADRYCIGKSGYTLGKES